MSGNSGMTTKDKLTELINKDILKHVKMPWGKSERYGFIVNDKRHQYNGKTINKNLENIINALYIDMSGKRLNKKNNY
jgi:hypothetical protein